MAGKKAHACFSLSKCQLGLRGALLGLSTWTVVHHLPPKGEKTHKKDGAGEGFGVKIASQDVDHTAGVIRD